MLSAKKTAILSRPQYVKLSLKYNSSLSKLGLTSLEKQATSWLPEIEVE